MRDANNRALFDRSSRSTLPLSITQRRCQTHYVHGSTFSYLQSLSQALSPPCEIGHLINTDFVVAVILLRGSRSSDGVAFLTRKSHPFKRSRACRPAIHPLEFSDSCLANHAMSKILGPALSRAVLQPGASLGERRSSPRRRNLAAHAKPNRQAGNPSLPLRANELHHPPRLKGLTTKTNRLQRLARGRRLIRGISTPAVVRRSMNAKLSTLTLGVASVLPLLTAE